MLLVRLLSSRSGVLHFLAQQKNLVLEPVDFHSQFLPRKGSDPFGAFCESSHDDAVAGGPAHFLSFLLIDVVAEDLDDSVLILNLSVELGDQLRSLVLLALVLQLGVFLLEHLNGIH